MALRYQVKVTDSNKLPLAMAEHDTDPNWLYKWGLEQGRQIADDGKYLVVVTDTKKDEHIKIKAVEPTPRVKAVYVEKHGQKNHYYAQLADDTVELIRISGRAYQQCFFYVEPVASSVQRPSGVKRFFTFGKAPDPYYRNVQHAAIPIKPIERKPTKPSLHEDRGKDIVEGITAHDVRYRGQHPITVYKNPDGSVHSAKWRGGQYKDEKAAQKAIDALWGKKDVANEAIEAYAVDNTWPLTPSQRQVIQKLHRDILESDGLGIRNMANYRYITFKIEPMPPISTYGSKVFLTTDVCPKNAFTDAPLVFAKHRLMVIGPKGGVVSLLGPKSKRKGYRNVIIYGGTYI